MYRLPAAHEGVHQLQVCHRSLVHYKLATSGFIEQPRPKEGFHSRKAATRSWPLGQKAVARAQPQSYSGGYEPARCSKSLSLKPPPLCSTSRSERPAGGLVGFGSVSHVSFPACHSWCGGRVRKSGWSRPLLQAAAAWSIGTRMFNLACQVIWRISDVSTLAFAEMIVRGEKLLLLELTSPWSF